MLELVLGWAGMTTLGGLVGYAVYAYVKHFREPEDDDARAVIEESLSGPLPARRAPRSSSPRYTNTAKGRALATGATQAQAPVSPRGRSRSRGASRSPGRSAPRSGVTCQHCDKRKKVRSEQDTVQ